MIYCSSCDKQRAELTPKKSRLYPQMTLFLCAECHKSKMEPRFMIILYGRSFGAATVADYIKARRYTGEEILAKELIS